MSPLLSQAEGSAVGSVTVSKFVGPAETVDLGSVPFLVGAGLQPHPTNPTATNIQPGFTIELCARQPHFSLILGDQDDVRELCVLPITKRHDRVQDFSHRHVFD